MQKLNKTRAWFELWLWENISRQCYLQNGKMETASCVMKPSAFYTLLRGKSIENSFRNTDPGILFTGSSFSACRKLMDVNFFDV